jgi:signal transduction histidine kinase
MRLVDQLRTTTFLLTVRYMMLFFASVCVLWWVFINVTKSYLESEMERSVDADMQALTELGRRTSPEAIAQVIAARVQTNPDGDSVYLLADRNFKPLVGNIGTWPELTTLEDGWVEFERTNRTGEVTAVRAMLHRPQNDLWLLVGRQFGWERLKGLLNISLSWGLGISLALAFAAGLLMSANVVRRVQAINATSRRIMRGDLSQRISTQGSQDEFDELALNLNAMLNQIENLMASVQHMSDNVAHDLRTPLTRLRNRLERLQKTAVAQDAEAIEACLTDADGLLETFASLLSIARIESGTTGSNEPVNLSLVTTDACELYQAVAEEKSIDLHQDLAGSIQVKGDRNLIFQALTNLLDNAIKYTPEGGRVDVRLTQDLQTVRLSVADSGPGIPVDRREKVLQRFYRLDESRSEPGSGLGLSLVRAIAVRHKAELRLEDNDPGLRVTLQFPVPVAAEESP